MFREIENKPFGRILNLNYASVSIFLYFDLIWFDSILLFNMFQYFWFGRKESEIVCEWEFECNKSVAMGKQAYKMLQLLNETNWIYIDKVKILKYAIQ